MPASLPLCCPTQSHISALTHFERSFSCETAKIVFSACRLTPCMRAPPPAPLIVATSFPLPSGLARFTSCELPNDAALFSPDILRFSNIQLVQRCCVHAGFCSRSLFSQVRPFNFVSILGCRQWRDSSVVVCRILVCCWRVLSCSVQVGARVNGVKLSGDFLRLACDELGLGALCGSGSLAFPHHHHQDPALSIPTSSAANFTDLRLRSFKPYLLLSTSSSRK